jgi:hypothetical protein
MTGKAGMAGGVDHDISDASAYTLEEEYADHKSESSDESIESGNPPSPAAPDFDEVPSVVHLTDCKHDEKYEISSTLEHLIVAGNFCRHHYWRVGEWQRTEVGKSTNLLSIDDVLHIDAAIDESRSLKRRRTDSKSERNTAQSIIHAQDARIYTPINSEYSGLEPVPWPKRPFIAGKEVYVPDRKWVEELSDPVHPVSLSLMRLSGVTHVPAPTKIFGGPVDSLNSLRHVEYDLFPDERCDDISPSEASRAMLLHCWERAVHAASSSVIVVPFETESHPHYTEPSISDCDSPPKLSRDDAVKMCEKLQIHDISPIHILSQADCDTVMECSSCRTVFLSEYKLHDHFWGTPSLVGCCWKYIERQRQRRIADILDSDVCAVFHQLISLVMRDLSPIESGDTRATTLLDCFDVWRLLQKQLAISRTIAIDGAESSEDVYETVEVERFQPPLPINAAVLESVLLRLVDRYGRVPR